LDAKKALTAVQKSVLMVILAQKAEGQFFRKSQKGSIVMLR
jgi:hypothetical protein